VVANCYVSWMNALNMDIWCAVRQNMGVGGGWPSLDFENYSQKTLFSKFRVGKNKFHHFWPPPGKIPSALPPGKNPSDAHATNYCMGLMLSNFVPRLQPYWYILSSLFSLILSPWYAAREWIQVRCEAHLSQTKTNCLKFMMQKLET